MHGAKIKIILAYSLLNKTSRTNAEFYCCFRLTISGMAFFSIPMNKNQTYG
jgi:hypothetical protein